MQRVIGPLLALAVLPVLESAAIFGDVAAAARDLDLVYARVDDGPLALEYAGDHRRELDDMLDHAGRLLADGRLEEAAVALEALVMKDSGQIPALLALGEVYFRLGRGSESLGIAQVLARLPEQRLEATRLQVRALNALKRYREAGEIARSYAEGRLADPLLTLEARLARGNAGEAVAVLGEFARALKDRAAVSDSDDARIAAGIFHLAAGNTEEASRCFEDIAASLRGSQRSIAAQTILLAGRGDYLGALDLARRAAIAADSTADMWNNLAALLIVSNQLAEARSCLAKALEIDPGHFPAVHQMTSLLVTEGNVTGAVAVCGAALLVHSNSARINQRMGQLLVQQRDWLGARSHLRRALEINPDVKGAAYVLAVLAQSQGDERGAVRLLERELALNTNHVGALNNLAWIRATTVDPGLRDVPGAVAAARQACELTGYRSLEEVDTLVECLLRAGDPERAGTIV